MSHVKNLKNEEITAGVVFLIGNDGEKLGDTGYNKAMAMADGFGLDLVQVRDGDVPVCKIMDLNKTSFKKQKVVKQKPIKIKELRFGMGIALHDLEIKTKQASKFLQKGNRVKIVLRKNRRRGVTEEDMNNSLNNILDKINVDFNKDDKISKSSNMWSIGISP